MGKVTRSRFKGSGLFKWYPFTGSKVQGSRLNDEGLRAVKADARCRLIIHAHDNSRFHQVPSGLRAKSTKETQKKRSAPADGCGFNNVKSHPLLIRTLNPEPVNL